ncbi:hypothetical protein [Photobacterium lipolyticum]|uniref:Curlin n=1 Tax=Photobacterium lipolyticum TaxID=266810 RepID=A0A2T3MZ39_9GAMM|nr:hypothetical protein [Photobacterium lipolyticum]PSW05170.1 hypothetical protein C9I89_10305 [Photobacterium lipolyticum]
MRKTNIALFVAVVVSSPIAFASGGDWGGGSETETNQNVDNTNIVIDDVANHKLDYSATDSFNKDLEITGSFKSDDDKLIMTDMNNTDIDKEIEDSYNSLSATDNSKHTYSETFTFTMEKNEFVAESDLEGEVTHSEVTYGAGSGGKYGGHSYGKNYGHGQAAGSELKVTQSNDMSNAFASASGINIAGQNAGNNALVQQSVSTNAILSGQ